MTYAEKIINFNRNLQLDEAILPEGIKVMNPFKGDNSETALDLSDKFYNKYYNDNKKRHIILGINPGRFGAGVTGLPFTDTKRLENECNINVSGFKTHEPSSVFIYEMINAFGGVEKFYNNFFLTALCPLGFVKEKSQGKFVNYNFYDNKKLENAVKPFIVDTLLEQISFGVYTDSAVLLGTGKNLKFMANLNEELQLFKEIIPLEHPRYIMQYKQKQKSQYINKYVDALTHLIET